MTAHKMQHRDGGARLSGGPDPPIPDKLYFRIGEVAALCGVATSVLRFWESEFAQLKPNKGGNGQRLYRRRDLEMALRIKGLLYGDGMTIPGARRALQAEPGVVEPQLSLAIVENEGSRPPDRKALGRLRSQLSGLAEMLSAAPVAGASGRGKTRRAARMVPVARGGVPELFDAGEMEVAVGPSRTIN